MLAAAVYFELPVAALPLTFFISFYFLFHIIDSAPVHGVDFMIQFEFCQMIFSAAFDIRGGHQIQK